MARLLYKHDSTAQHTRWTRRHIRLCGQVKGAASYAQAIQPKREALIQKEKALLDAEEVSENAYDDLVLKDADLDDAVRTLFERARQHDRENGGALSVLLFPDLTFSDIVNMPYSEEPRKVETIIQKLESLDPANEVRPLAEILRQKVTAVDTALDARKLAANAIRRAQVDVELAKNELRAQYENNYLDARRALGKQTAESLFPKVVHKKVKKQEEEATAETEE